MVSLKTWVFILSLAASLGGGLGLGVIVTKATSPEPAECQPAASGDAGEKTFKSAPVKNTNRDKGY